MNKELKKPKMILIKDGIRIDYPDGGYEKRINGDYYSYNAYGQLHSRGDKPAIVWPDGTKCWYKNGNCHRAGDNPAVISPDGTKYWYKNGKYHRDGDNPAIIYPDGTKFWYKNGNYITAVTAISKK